MPLIIPSNSITGGYEVDNSLRFNDGSSDYLSRTPSSTGNTKKFTISFWCKRSALGTNQEIFHVFSGSGQRSQILFLSGDTLQIELETANLNKLVTSRVFRDPSAWMHIVVVYDSDNGTSGNRVILYVNGVRETSFSTENYPSSGSTSGINTTTQHEISSYDGAGYFYDGYLSEFVLLDGIVADPTSFGEFDADTGIWKPIDVSGLTFGTNGFYLDFENSGSLGADVSGNGNNFTVNNLTSIDQTTDTPTNNFATMNPLDKSGITLSEGNLKIFNNTGAHQSARGNFGMSSGKWYFEGSISSVGASQQQQFGLARQNVTCPSLGSSGDTFITYWGFAGANSNHFIYNDGSNTGYTLVPTAVGDILKCAYDADSGKLWLGKNTDWFNINGGIDASANPATGTNPTMTLSETEPLVPYGHLYANSGTWNMFNFGQEGSFAGNKTAQGNSDQNGYGDFYYAPPSGYLALCTQNLATELSPTIDDGSQYFNTKLYTGAGASQTITGVGFQPDLAWIKQRNSTFSHVLMDIVRGNNLKLSSNLTSAENGLGMSLASDGYTLSTTTDWVNGSGSTYVGWNWFTDNTSGSSNTDGSITSQVSASTTSGFSIVSYAGNGSAGATVGHGLNQKPELFIVRSRNGASARGWMIYDAVNGATKFLQLDTSAASTTSSAPFNNTEPTNNVFSVDSVGGYVATNGITEDYIAYCFHSVKGFSKIGSYTGNGNADGTFVYTGFKPAWVMTKRINSTGSWYINDNKRSSTNVVDDYILANSGSAESVDTSVDLDFLSNGFKYRGTAQNVSGSTYIYMAFAENPFVTSTGVPCTAR